MQSPLDGPIPPSSPSIVTPRRAHAWRWAHVLLHLATLVLTGTTLVTLPRAAQAMVVTDEVPIPAGLVLPLDPMGRPSPVCSQCQLTAKTAPSVGDDAALVWFTFVGEAGEGYDGGLRIKVVLQDGSVRWPYTSSVSLDDHETLVIELHADPYEFEWGDAARLELELVP